MSKSARIKRQRAAMPPTTGRRAQTRTVWLATAGVALVVAVVVGVLLSTRTGSSAPAAAPLTAADAGASPSLVRAANAVAFHPTTEPGIGEIEGQPASAGQGSDNPNLLRVGTVAPPFALRTPQGKTVSLASYRGHAVLLEFFATWCPHCNAEAPHLAKLARSLEGRGVRFVSVNADGETAPSVFAFHRYYGLPYPALVDPSSQPGSFRSQGDPGKVTTAYRVASYPTFYVLSPRGKIVWQGDGEQPDALLRAWLLEAAEE